MEERIVETREAYPSTTLSIPKNIENEMADGTWMARNQLLKPVQVSQAIWQTTQQRGADVIEFDYPQILGENESLVLRTLRMYAFYKLSPCFRVQINATVFHQGQLICAFDPYSYCDNPFTTANYVYNHIYATGLPNVKIMASHSDAIELKLPFIHPRSYLTTNTPLAYNNLGTFRITVLNPLIAAEGASPNLTVTVWAYAENAEVHVPIQDHTPILAFEAPEEPELVETSFIENIKKIPGHLTDIAGNLASGNVGQALRKGQGLIDTLGDMFGFDYPARTLQPPKTISPIENLALSKGVSQSQRLALDPYSLQSLDDEIASESKEAMNLKRIAQMPMLLTQFEFSGTNPPGTLLKTIYVNPCVSPVVNTNSLQRTYLSYVANGFVYWSGGIVYNVEIVATKFHSGKLIFAYVPNTDEVPSYSAVSDSLPNVIVDIQQSSAMKFVVPFTSSTPMKATFAPTDDLNDLNFIDSCTGTLVCYVQNALAYASNVASSIEINIYVSAAQDFSLYVPQRPVFNRNVPQPTSFEKLDLQETSILLNTNKNEGQDTSVVLSLGKGISMARNHFGEDYSLLDLIKRFSPGETITLTSAEPSRILSVSPTIFDFDNPQLSYLSYWSKLYNCWSGSLRFKFLAKTNKDSTSSLHAVHIPTSASALIPSLEIINTEYAYGGFGMAKTQIMQDCGLEIEVPYYSRYNMLFTSGSLATIYAPILNDMYYNGYLSITSTPGDDEEDIPEIETFIAAGDDFRLVYVRPPPIDQTNTILSITTL